MQRLAFKSARKTEELAIIDFDFLENSLWECSRIVRMMFLGRTHTFFVGGASPLVREMRVLSEKSLSFIVEDGVRNR